MIKRAAAGELHHQNEERDVTPVEIERALSDMRRLTEGGIIR